MASIPPSDPDTKQRVRSPAYPYVSLPKAIEYARTLWGHTRHHEARAAAAIASLGFSPKSGPGAQTLAALIHFGLLEASGSKEMRTVKLTDLALRILGESNPQSPERRAAVRKAAFLPKLYVDLVNKYGESTLPSDATIRDFLTFERRFNEEAVDDVIGSFRDTLAYLEPPQSDTVTAVDGSSTDMDRNRSGLAEDDQIEPHEPGPQPTQLQGPREGSRPMLPATQQREPSAGLPQDANWLSLEVPYRGSKMYIRVGVQGETLNRKHIQKAIKHLDLASEDMDD